MTARRRADVASVLVALALYALFVVFASAGGSQPGPLCEEPCPPAKEAAR